MRQRKGADETKSVSKLNGTVGIDTPEIEGSMKL